MRRPSFGGSEAAAAWTMESAGRRARLEMAGLKKKEERKEGRSDSDSDSDSGDSGDSDEEALAQLSLLLDAGVMRGRGETERMVREVLNERGPRRASERSKARSGLERRRRAFAREERKGKGKGGVGGAVLDATLREPLLGPPGEKGSEEGEDGDEEKEGGAVASELSRERWGRMWEGCARGCGRGGPDGGVWDRWGQWMAEGRSAMGEGRLGDALVAFERASVASDPGAELAVHEAVAEAVAEGGLAGAEDVDPAELEARMEGYLPRWPNAEKGVAAACEARALLAWAQDLREQVAAKAAEAGEPPTGAVEAQAEEMLAEAWDRACVSLAENPGPAGSGEDHPFLVRALVVDAIHAVGGAGMDVMRKAVERYEQALGRTDGFPVSACVPPPVLLYQHALASYAEMQGLLEMRRRYLLRLVEGRTVDVNLYVHGGPSPLAMGHSVVERLLNLGDNLGQFLGLSLTVDPEYGEPEESAAWESGERGGEPAQSHFVWYELLDRHNGREVEVGADLTPGCASPLTKRTCKGRARRWLAELRAAGAQIRFVMHGRGLLHWGAECEEDVEAELGLDYTRHEALAPDPRFMLLREERVTGQTWVEDPAWPNPDAVSARGGPRRTDPTGGGAPPSPDMPPLHPVLPPTHVAGIRDAVHEQCVDPGHPLGAPFASTLQGLRLMAGLNPFSGAPPVGKAEHADGFGFVQGA